MGSIADHIVRLAHPEAEVDIDCPEDLPDLASADAPGIDVKP